MPVDPKAVLAVHDEVRALFKDSFKSGNKIYTLYRPAAAEMDALGMDAKMAALPSKEKAERRNENMLSANLQIKRMQEFSAPWRDQYPADYGYYVLDQNELAGNCTELACVAAYLCSLKQLHFVWVAYMQYPGNHAFCVVTDGSPPTMETVGDFYKERTRIGWIIDPWANICCPIHQYAAHFVLHMRHWSAQGKQFHNARASKRAGKTIFTAPDTLGALTDFRRSAITYNKAGRAGIKALPKAYRDRLPFWSSLKWPMAF